MPKVSVLIPVYNVKDYLRKCLDSILVQTLSDLEIICIDDGSSDGSELILDEYSKKDHRIRVIHKQNSGYGATLNVGLDAALGDYVGIVESDDCILPQMYKELYESAVENDLDMVKSEAYYWYETLQYTQRIHISKMNHVFNTILTDADRNIFMDFFMNIWTGIYKRQFLKNKNIRFNETPGASYQDNGFWLQTILYAKKCMWLDDAFYLYRQDNPEASVKSKGKVYAMTREYEYVEKLLIERGDYHLLPYCSYGKLTRERGVFIRVADEVKLEFCKQLEKDYHKHKASIKFNGFLDEWYRNVLNDPVVFCNNFVSCKKKVEQEIDNADGIIIYGAGKRAIFLFRIIYNLGSIDKINCFAVTKDVQRGEIATKKVELIEDAVKQYPNSLIIISPARDSEAYCSMHMNLKELGVINIMDGSLFDGFFYLV